MQCYSCSTLSYRGPNPFLPDQAFRVPVALFLAFQERLNCLPLDYSFLHHRASFNLYGCQAQKVSLNRTNSEGKRQPTRHRMGQFQVVAETSKRRSEDLSRGVAKGGLLCNDVFPLKPIIRVSGSPSNAFWAPRDRFYKVKGHPFGPAGIGENVGSTVFRLDIQRGSGSA